MYGVARINSYKNKAANESKSGRSNSPYGFSGMSKPSKMSGGGKGMGAK
jgi:hypothetical protein